MPTKLKLPRPCKTPRGNSVKVVVVCLDVEYEIVDGRIVLIRASLAKTPVDCRRCYHPARSSVGFFGNVYSPYTGEEWYANELDLYPEYKLLQALIKEQCSKRGYELRNKLLEEWPMKDRQSAARDFIDAINLQLPIDLVGEMIQESESRRVRLNYVKSSEVLSRRDVTIHGVNPARNFILLTDHKDGVNKNFFLEKVTDVEPEVPYRRR
ncbi:MAG: hypothetical protein U0929_18760 [Planctomycetaceae bacterium]